MGTVTTDFREERLIMKKEIPKKAYTDFLSENSYKGAEFSFHPPHNDCYSKIFFVQFKGVPQIELRIDTSLKTISDEECQYL